MIRIFLFSILLSLSATTPAAEPSYYRFSTDEFFEMERVQTPIDLENFDKELLEAAIFYAANEVRKEKNKPVFDYNGILNQAARFHAEYLKEKKLVDHFNRHEKKYRTPYDRSKVFDGDFTAIAENLARIPIYKLGGGGEFFVDESGHLVDRDRQPLQSSTYAELARRVVDGWMNSKGHRENMMGDFELLGVGVSGTAYNKNGIPELYLVQNFGNQ